MKPQNVSGDFVKNMKKIKTQPNLYLLIISSVFIIAFAIFSCFLSYYTINLKEYFYCAMSILLIGISVMLYSQLSEFFTSISFLNSEIIIYQPLKFRLVKFSKDSIKGFSTSKMYFGRGNLYSSESFIFYSHKTAYEIIKLYNFNFEFVLNSFKTSEIPFLGNEEYEPGTFKRKYKFLN